MFVCEGLRACAPSDVGDLPFSGKAAQTQVTLVWLLHFGETPDLRSMRIKTNSVSKHMKSRMGVDSTSAL